MSAHPFTHVRHHFIRGLLLVLPLLITLWTLRLLFNLIDDNVTPWVWGALNSAGIRGLELWLARLGVPAIGILLTVTFVYLLGLLVANFAGRRLVRSIEEYVFLRIPVVKSIYGAARQLLDAFGMSGKRAFSRVVLLEYPRHGLWALGFVASETTHELGVEPMTAGGGAVAVFLPTSPNPTSGWMVLVPTRDLLEVDLSIEDGVKLIVSGGIVCPDDLGARVRPWSALSAPSVAD